MNVFVIVVNSGSLNDYLFPILNTRVLILKKKIIVIYGDLILFYQ